MAGCSSKMTNTTYAIVTAADRRYFGSVVSLLESLRRSNNDFDCKIFDLGLTKWQREWLEASLSSNQLLLPLPSKPNLFAGWDLAKTRDNFAWKPVVIESIAQSYSGAFWADAGVLITGNLEDLVASVNRKGALVYKNYDHRNESWTTKSCLEVMDVSDKELAASQVMGNFFAFSFTSKLGIELFNDWVYWSSNPRAIKGDAKQHRHDQTILSILVARHGIELTEYADSTAIARFKIDYQEALKSKIVFLAHRRWLLLAPKKLNEDKKMLLFLFRILTLSDMFRLLRFRTKWRLRWSRLGVSVATLVEKITFQFID